MDNFAAGIRAVLVTAVTSGVLAALYASVRKKERNLSAGTLVVHLPRGVAVIGAICMLFFGAILAIAPLSYRANPPESPLEPFWVIGIFGLFFLLGLVLTVWPLRWRLLVSNTGIEYTPVLGHTQFIYFEELYFMQQRGQRLAVYDHYGKRAFTAESLSVGFRILADRLQARGIQYGKLSAYRRNAAALGMPGGQRQRHYGKKSKPPAPAMPQPVHSAPGVREDLPPDLPENADEILRALLLDGVQLLASPATQPLPLGAGKVGGAPDLPPGFVWPYHAATGYDGTFANRPLAFLLQLPCADLKPYDTQNLLPESGLFSVFYELESMPWGPATAAEGYFRFFWFDAPAERLVHTPLPAGLKAEYHIPEGTLRYARIKTAPGYAEFATGLALHNHKANWGAYENAKEKLGITFPDASQVLGYPGSIQNDVFDDFEIARLAGRVLTDADRAALAKRRLAQDWCLLLQLDSSLFEAVGAPQIMFGDAGSLYFAIRKDHLTARRFSEVWHILQCY